MGEFFLCQYPPIRDRRDRPDPPRSFDSHRPQHPRQTISRDATPLGPPREQFFSPLSSRRGISHCTVGRKTEVGRKRVSAINQITATTQNNPRVSRIQDFPCRLFRGTSVTRTPCSLSTQATSSCQNRSRLRSGLPSLSTRNGSRGPSAPVSTHSTILARRYGMCAGRQSPGSQATSSSSSRSRAIRSSSDLHRTIAIRSESTTDCSEWRLVLCAASEKIARRTNRVKSVASMCALAQRTTSLPSARRTDGGKRRLESLQALEERLSSALWRAP